MCVLTAKLSQLLRLVPLGTFIVYKISHYWTRVVFITNVNNFNIVVTVSPNPLISPPLNFGLKWIYFFKDWIFRVFPSSSIFWTIAEFARECWPINYESFLYDNYSSWKSPKLAHYMFPFAGYWGTDVN